MLNKIIEEKKDVTKEILGDRAIKPSRDLAFPYDTFNMNNGNKEFLIYDRC